MRHARLVVLLGLAAVALAVPSGVRALNWSTVTVDSAGNAGVYSSLAIAANGDLFVSYYDGSNTGLKFAFCSLLASANTNCDHAGDWTTTLVDSAGNVGFYTSLALAADGDPVISYHDRDNADLKFAICDVSASAGGNCGQPGDWNTVTVDSTGSVGENTSIAAAGGDPVISYYDRTNGDLKFATCARLASANGNCGQPGDWTATTVDSAGSVGFYTAIAVTGSTDPVVSYYDVANADLKFAICDRLASANGNCDQTGDWSTTTVDSMGSVGDYPSVAVAASGNPAISYHDGTDTDLKFATCDRLASASGSCDQTGDWSTTTVESAGSVGFYTAIAVTGSGNPMIAHYDATNQDLKFAACDRLASVSGRCDQPGDWASETVDSQGSVGRLPSVAVDAGGNPLITYVDDTNFDLKFVTASPGNPDSDGDGFPNSVDGCPTTPTPWPTPIGDSDCDGFTDSEEAFVGTDPRDACANSAVADDEADDRWPADFNDDQSVNVLDIVQLTPPYFNASFPEPAYAARKDFNGDEAINILDIVRLTPPMFNQTCA